MDEPSSPDGVAPTFRRGEFRSLSRRQAHRVAYVEWGDERSDRVVVCVHGLSRQGRDFDRLAAALATLGYRVVCPDLVGRGSSGHLPDADDYALPQYATDMMALIARTGAGQVDWVGTSLGGLIGIVLAGMADTPIRRLVVNDIGPFLPWKALRRLGDNLLNAPLAFPDLDAVERHLRSTLKPFGELRDEDWSHLARHSVALQRDGRYAFRFDRGIAQAFRPGRVYNVSLWQYWDAIRCPVLVLRGETSDLLERGTAVEMTKRGPRAELVEIAGCGHAPALLDDAQIGVVTGWLGQHQARSPRVTGGGRG